MRAYYNEFDPYAAQWLRNLIDAGLIPHGDVDERSIVDVAPTDLSGYTQCHFFAGIGGWAYAARLAGWPDSRELWTGSCPCQPFSVAGAQRGTDDERHLWPRMFRLIRARRPAVVMGEQVAAAVGKNWLDGVCADLESIGYACGAAVVPACAVDAPHRRDRLWFVADADHAGLEGFAGHELHAAQGRGQSVGPAAASGLLARAERCDACGTAAESCGCFPPIRTVADADGERGEVHPDAGWREAGSGARKVTRPRSAWDGTGWIIGHDGKARRVEPGIRLLAHGVPARVGRLRAYGNAIVPQVAAEVIGAYLDAERAP